MSSPRIHAPFTPAQVESLNAFAHLAHVRHPGRDGRLCDHEPTATRAGWRCTCGWRQSRAYSFMASGARATMAKGSSPGKPAKPIEEVRTLGDLIESVGPSGHVNLGPAGVPSDCSEWRKQEGLGEASFVRGPDGKWRPIEKGKARRPGARHR